MQAKTTISMPLKKGLHDPAADRLCNQAITRLDLHPAF